MTRDPGDVGEQCSNTWQPLDSKLDPVQVRGGYDDGFGGVNETD